MKGTVAKVKGKNKELKVQWMMAGNDKENASVGSVANSMSTKQSTAKKPAKSSGNTSRYAGDDDS